MSLISAGSISLDSTFKGRSNLTSNDPNRKISFPEHHARRLIYDALTQGYYSVGSMDCMGFDFYDVPLVSYCICHFHSGSGKIKTYWINNTYWRFLQNHIYTLPDTILKWPRLHSKRFLWTSKTSLRSADKNISEQKHEQLGFKSSASQSIEKKDGRQIIWQWTSINIIYPIRFLLIRAEKMAKTTAHQKLIFKVQKPVEAFI